MLPHRLPTAPLSIAPLPIVSHRDAYVSAPFTDSSGSARTVSTDRVALSRLCFRTAYRPAMLPIASHCAAYVSAPLTDHTVTDRTASLSFRRPLLIAHCDVHDCRTAYRPQRYRPHRFPFLRTGPLPIASHCDAFVCRTAYRLYRLPTAPIPTAPCYRSRPALPPLFTATFGFGSYRFSSRSPVIHI